MRILNIDNWDSFRRLVFGLAFVACLFPALLAAGELNAPAAPNNANSAMFSIEAIYQRLLNGSAGDKRGGTPGTFQEPSGAPGSTMHSLNDVMGVAPAKDTVDGGSPDQVVTGKKFWGLKDGAGWGLLGGTMPMAAITADSVNVKGGYIATTTLTAIDADLTTDNIKAGKAIFGVPGKTEVVDTSSGDAVAADLQAGKIAWVDGTEVTGAMPVVSTSVTPSATTQTIPTGYYNGLASVTGDANLVSANIKAGTSIFGVSGSSAVVDTSSGNAAAGDIMAGKQAWVNGVLATGTHYAGVVINDPNPANWSTNRRWHNNGDGTITDTTTGLIWKRNAGALAATFDDTGRTLNSYLPNNHWRLPTLVEFQGIVTGTDPVVTGSTHFFTDVQTAYYWTSSHDSSASSYYSIYSPLDQQELLDDTVSYHPVWAVRNP